MDWMFLIESVKDDLLRLANDTDPNGNTLVNGDTLREMALNLEAVLNEVSG